MSLNLVLASLTSKSVAILPSLQELTLNGVHSATILFPKLL